jgi:hypothetical protein
VIDGSKVITGKQSGDSAIETKTFAVDIIILGRDCGITPSGNGVHSEFVASKKRQLITCEGVPPTLAPRLSKALYKGLGHQGPLDYVIEHVGNHRKC